MKNIKKIVFGLSIILVISIIYVISIIKFENGFIFLLSSNNNSSIIKYLGNEKNIAIPNDINGHVVVEISNCAFYSKEIESIKIPDTVEVIGDFAFANNYLKTVKMPSKLIYIGKSAFMMNNITSLKIP